MEILTEKQTESEINKEREAFLSECSEVVDFVEDAVKGKTLIHQAEKGLFACILKLGKSALSMFIR